MIPAVVPFPYNIEVSNVVWFEQPFNGRFITYEEEGINYEFGFWGDSIKICSFKGLKVAHPFDTNLDELFKKLVEIWRLQ